MTPLPNAEPETPQHRYNTTLTTTRNGVERCIGVLKGRFRCLLRERTLRYDPRKTGIIISACCVLHNMCMQGGIPDDDFVQYTSDDSMNAAVAPDNTDHGNEGFNHRTNVINSYFNQRQHRDVQLNVKICSLVSVFVSPNFR